jgi:hypothetical protein
MPRRAPKTQTPSIPEEVKQWLSNQTPTPINGLEQLADTISSNKNAKLLLILRKDCGDTALFAPSAALPPLE